MKTVEVRRHSIRGAGKNLSPEGVALAKKVRAELAPSYDLCITSSKERAMETMEAFGFTNYSIDDSFTTLDDSVLAKHRREIDEVASKKGCSTFYAVFEIPEAAEALRGAGQAYLKALKRVAHRLPDGGRALVVSHGGAIEPAALLGFSVYHLREMGGELKPCEGAIFYIEADELTKVEIRRLDG
jgi:broad specificity phosphatase PhoE